MDNLDQDLGGLPVPTKSVTDDNKKSSDLGGLPVPKKKVGTSGFSDITSQSTSSTGWEDKIKQIKEGLINAPSKSTSQFNEPGIEKYVPTNPELAKAAGVETKKGLYEIQNPELAKEAGVEPIKQTKTLIIGKEMPIKHAPNVKRVKSPAQILKEEQDLKNQAISNTIAIRKKSETAINTAWTEDKEKKDIEYKLATGEYEVGADPKTGNPTIMRAVDQGYFNTLWDTYNKDYNRTLENQAFTKLPKQDAINQLNVELWQEETNQGAEYLPYKNKGILPWLGEKTAEIGGPLLKAGAYGIGMLTGAGRATGGLEMATSAALRASKASQAGNVLSFIEDMGFSGYTDNLKRTYKDLKKQNPQMSDEEAFDKAQNAGYFGEAAGIGAGAAMGGTFSKLKDAVTKVEVQPFINSLKHLGGEGLKQGGYASLSSLVTDLGAKSQGYRISPKDILENSINRGIDMAALTYVLGGTGLAAKEIIQSKHTAAAVQAMGIVSGAIKVPKPIIAQAKQVVSQLPLDEVQKIYQTAEDSGVLPEGSTEKAMNGLNNFIKTEFQVPEGLSEELKASLKGIQEKINNLEESKSKLDKTYHPYMDEQIKKEREKAQKILETGDVFKNEVDDLGNPIENTKESLEEKDITVGEILDKRGTYNEENGQFFQDGQTVIFKPDNSNKIYEIGNVDEINDIPISKFGIKNEESVVTINDNGNLEVRGTEYINNYSDPLKAINKDKDGNVVSVNLETSKGQKRTFRGNVAEDLAYQINLGKNAKVEELPISPETQKPITIGFAPFREKNVLDIAQDQEIRNSPDYKLHQENLQKLAEGLGIPIVNKADTWGGYVDKETGRPVQEVSNVMQIEAKPDEARLMAAILGKAAPEKQDSVLIGNYDDNGVGFEHVIKIGNFEDAKNALNLLKDNGLEYFTVDKDSGDIIILDTNAEKTQNVINFVKQLNENGIKSEHEYQPINGEFVEQKDYDSIIAGERGKERQQKGFDIDAFIQEASGKYQEIKAQAEKAQATQSLADKIRSLKTEKGTLNLLPDLGLTKAIYDGALEFLAKQVEKGTKFGKAIQDTIEWIDKNVKGSNWDKELFSRHAISLSTESSVEAGKTQPAMILTAKKKGIEEITHAGENSLVALRTNKPDMYISRAEEISKSNLVLGKVRKYNSNWTSEQKLKWSDEVYNKAKSTVVSNLLYLYDNIPEKVRTISKLWYDGANKIAKEFANKYDITHEQSAAVIASQSPQKPWFDNLHLAHFIMDYNHNNKDAIFTKEAFDYYKKTGENYPAQVAYFKELEKSIGKKYSELSNYDKSVLIRNEFDNKYDRTAPLRLPTGHIVGRTKSNSSFSGYDTIVKAISILNNGSEKNISDNLGGASKVRNFNNNIIDPNSEKFATIDTHAMAAGYFLPLGSKSPEVKFDPATYSFFHDAYSEAAKQRGVLPREMQSITWEGVKSLFPPSDKTEANKSQARELWNKYKNGEITLEELQKTIKENGKDLSKTDWSGLIDRSLKEGETGGFVEELPLNSRGRETGGQGVAGRPTTEVPTMEGRVEPTEVEPIAELDKIIKQKAIESTEEVANAASLVFKDAGFHVGELPGKSDYLQPGYNGEQPYTGYYFLSNPAQVVNRNSRFGKSGEFRIVDFSQYNLYKPKTEEYWETKAYLKKFVQNSDNFDKAYEDFIKNLKLSPVLKKAINDYNKPKQIQSELYQLEKALETVKSNREFQQINNRIAEIDKQLQQLKGKDSFKEDLKKKLDLYNKKGWDKNQYGDESKERFETIMLKILGYEGVDVRGLKEERGTGSPDKFSEGSVIFDLKPETVETLSGAYEKAKLSGKNPNLVNKLETIIKPKIAEVEPTISEKGKKIADTLRKGKIILDKDVLQSNIAGVPIALYNTVIETIAKAIEAGSNLTEAIVYAIEKHKLGNINEFNKSEFVKKVADITGEKIEIKEPTKEIEVEVEVAPRLVSGVSHKALQDIAENLGLPEVERGTGLTPKEYAERGRAFINSGVNPEDIAAQFKITKKANADDISIVRAYAEDLLKAADDARSEFGENSKEFKNAKRIYDNWTRNVVKPMGTAAGQSFTALQGGTDIDTGSFVQMQSAYEEKTGKPLTEEQKLQIEKLTTDNKNLTTKLKDLTKKLTEVINKAVNEQVKVEEKEVGKVKEEFKKIARFIRKGKLSRPDIFSAATPASLVWDGALEVAAKTVEVSGDIAQAIADGVEHVKNSDWYKNLNANQQKDAQKAFVDYVKENSEDKTAKRIQRLEAELDDLRNRREKETKNKELIEKTQKELDLEDQIKSEKRVIKLEEELQDIVDGKEKEPTKKQKREKTQRELDLENKIEKAKFENFTKRFVDKTDSNFNVEDVRDIWNYAKSEYLDKDASFEEMLSGVAKDLGLSTKQVRDAITLPKQARTISDEMYSTINKRKAAIAQAKSYVQNAGQSKATGFFKSIPSFFFKLKTAGHGTVGGITHAGMNLFQPSEYKTYFPFFIKQFNFAFGKIANYERAMEDLKNDSSFKFWKDAGLAVDPSEKYDDYQGEFIKQSWWDKLGAVGNRGFNALKVYRLDLAKSFYDGLSASEKADPNTAKELAKLVNHATGTSEINTPKWTSTAFFAPKLEISRWQGLIGDPVKATKTFLDWGNATPAEKAMAKRVAKNAGEKIATYIALLTANAGILAATGSKDKINFDDPSKGDWLKFKIAGKTIDPTGGIEATMRFIYTMMNSAQTAYTGTKKELRRKPQETQFQTVGTQLRYKLSPFASTAMDIFTGTDAMGRPLPWSKVKPRKGEKPYTIGGYLAQQQTPIPVSEALHEVKSSMKEKGMDDAQINDILKGIGVGLISGGTGVKVQDVPKEKKRY
tara:strand:+ start:781 stop:9306 length:8526 start_codon:yes stop_codon:yes gene_type:complete